MKAILVKVQRMCQVRSHGALLCLVACVFLLVTTYSNSVAVIDTLYFLKYSSQDIGTQISGNLSLNEPHVPWWDGGLCKCERQVCVPEGPVERASMARVGGTCGQRAWEAGGGQKVISLSLYGEEAEYWEGLDDILSKVATMYPGWMVRLYTVPDTRSAYLCPLLSRHPHLYVCDVGNLPLPLGNITNIHPMMWRVAALGDPQLETLMVRDTDMPVSKREFTAVQAWLASDKTFHVMRDHPFHCVSILGGLWGVRWRQEFENSSMITVVKMNMLADSLHQTNRGYDQNVLGKWLWPLMKGRVLAHDSYCCMHSEGNVPWPTQRENGSFVGSRSYRKKYRGETLTQRCPKKCRPVEHQDWKFC
nr:uncharacterized protein LOC123751334 isoform X2 [Procambarus clarkii]